MLTATDARVSYTADWYDGIGRDVAETDYGVVAAADESVPSPPSATNVAPTTYDSSGLTQVTLTYYNPAGESYETIDPAGRVDMTDFDDEGRETDNIENYSTTETGAAYNISTATVYGAGDLVAYSSVTTGTTTEYTAYVYGTATGDSSPDLYTNELVRAEIEGVPESDLSSLVSTVNSDDLSALSGVQYTEYTYDRTGETTTTTDANLTVHTLTYNGLGAELTDTVTVPTGNPANIDMSGVTEIAFGYKVCGRLQTVESLDADGDVLSELYFQYDTNGNLDAEYESYNGPVDTSDLSASVYIGYGYDDTTSEIDDPALGEVYIATAGFRPTTLQYPTTGDNTSRTISDKYGESGSMDDEINQLDSIVDGAGTTSDGTSTVTEGDTLDTVGELGDGTIVSETYNQPNVGYNLLGTTGSTPNLDQFNRVQNMVWSNYTTDVNVDDFAYMYNLQGDTSMRANEVDAAFSEMYADDAADQLTSDTRGAISEGAIADPSYQENFSIDGVGNITGDTEQQTVSGTLTTTSDQIRTPTATNEIGTLTDSAGDTAAPVYDAAGNSTVTSSPLDPSEGLNIQVDGWNRPTHITYGSTIDVNYAYDGLGNAIVSINNLAPAGTASTTDMYYAGQQMIQSEQVEPSSPSNGETVVITQYVFSPRYVDSPILFTAVTATYDATSSTWSSASSTYYYLTDANYNVTTLLNAEGGVVERYVYTAYGTPTSYSPDYSSVYSTSAASNTVLFAGMDMDMQTGLYRDGLRWLSSATGTFITQDPAQQGANWYEYANSDPIDFTDPTGLYYGDAPAWTAPGDCASSAGLSTPSTGYVSSGSLTVSTPGEMTRQQPASFGDPTFGEQYARHFNPLTAPKPVDGWDRAILVTQDAGWVATAAGGTAIGATEALGAGGLTVGEAASATGAAYTQVNAHIAVVLYNTPRFVTSPITWGGAAAGVTYAVTRDSNQAFQNGVTAFVAAPMLRFDPIISAGRGPCPAVTYTDFADDAATIRANAVRSRGLNPGLGIRAAVKPTMVDVNKLSPPDSRPFAEPAKLEKLGVFDWQKYQPIHVEQDGSRLTIMSGMTRVEAARRAGILQLPAYVFPASGK